MRRRFDLWAGLALLASSVIAGDIGRAQAGPAAEQDAEHGAAAGKDAFEAAKELGTVEAWDAFLAAYPSGFHADLARAYVKKLAAGGNADPSPPHAASAVSNGAEELPCKLAPELKSENSATRAKITFANETRWRRTILWIDFKGDTVEYAKLEPGKDVTLDTYLTHPWMVMVAGNCSQIFKPVGELSLARLVTVGATPPRAEPRDEEEDKPRKAMKRRKVVEGDEDEPPRRKKKKKADTPTSKAKAQVSAAQSCKELGMKYANGQCVAKKKKDIERVKKNKNVACPTGMYRNPLGQCQPNETGG